MFNELVNIFSEFLEKFSNNQWAYIFVGLLIFVILVSLLCNIIKK